MGLRYWLFGRRESPGEGDDGFLWLAFAATEAIGILIVVYKPSERNGTGSGTNILVPELRLKPVLRCNYGRSHVAERDSFARLTPDKFECIGRRRSA